MLKTSVSVWRKPATRMLNIVACVVAIFALTTPSFAVVFTNPATITINDATAIGNSSAYPSGIAVSGRVGTTTNISVTLNNTNSTFPDDVDMLLVSPTGANLIIVSDTGGSDDMTNTTITLDDAGVPTIPDATRWITNTTYKPTNIGAGDIFNAPAPAPSANTTFAAAFNGADPNGTWNLFFVDDLGADMSLLGNGWSLTVTTTGSAAATFSSTAALHGGDGARGRATPYSSDIVSSGLTGAITDVNVTLTNVNHLNPDDIDILLVGPSGKSIILASDAGGTTDVVAANLTFDDAAAAVIPDAGPMVTGTVRPTNFGTGETIPDIPGPNPNSSTAGPATLASVFNGTNPNGTWKLYIVDDATTSAGTVTGGWSVDITAGGSFGAKRFTNADFGGDGKTDVSVYRATDGFWWSRESSNYANSARQFGAAADVPMPADYDGDNKTDLAVFRPGTGQWIILNSGSAIVSFTTWGTATDKPVPADFDADGKVDIAIFRPGDGNWWVRQSATSTTRVVPWGISTDIPLRGHFEGTSGADFAVFRPSEGNWYILNNAASSNRVVNWGAGTDELVPADYDCDGKSDVAIFRQSTGDWWIIPSGTGVGFTRHWGLAGGTDIAVMGDYDGDSCADTAIWRPTEQNWYINNSGFPNVAAASFRQDNWGLSTDTPLPATYVPAQ